MPRACVGVVFFTAICLFANARHAPGQEVASEIEPVVQPSPSQPAALDIQPAALEAQVQRIEASEEISADEKAKLAGLYRQALESAKAAETWQAKVLEYVARTQSAPDDLLTFRDELKQLEEKKDAEPLPKLPLEGLRIALATKESELVKLRQLASELEAAPKRRQDRLVEAPMQIASIKARLADVEKQLAATSSLDTPAARANRTVQLAQQAAMKAEAAALEKEIDSYQARAELLPLRAAVARQKLAKEEQQVARFREKVDALAKEELKRLAEEARCEAVNAHPAVRDLAEQYAEILEQRMALREEKKQLETKKLAAQEREIRIEEERSTTEDRVEATGLNAAFGALLSKQRDQLPNRRELQRNIAAREQRIDEIRLTQYELEDNLQQFNAEDELQRLLAGVETASQDAEMVADLEAEVDERLTKRQEELRTLLDDYNELLANIYLLDAAERALLRERDEFATFINERLLWLPNMLSIGPQDAVGAWHHSERLGRPGDWMDLLNGLGRDAATHPLLAFAFVVSVVTLVVLRPRLRGYIKRTGLAAQRGSFDQFLPTLQVSGASAVLALPAAWILGYFAWRIANMNASAELAVPVSSGLWTAALVVLVAEVWRQFCRADGLGEAHFGWSESSTKFIRGRIVRWIVPVAAFTLVIAAMSAMEYEAQAALLGRLVFVAGMLAATAPLYRLLRPQHGLMHDILAANHDGWLYRLRYVWCIGLVLVPPALAVLAGLGYYHTALKLTVRAFATICFAGGLLIVREVILRALLIARRRLAMEQARQRRAAARAAAEAAEEGSGAETAIAVEEPTVDLSAISGQTRRLVRAVLVMTALVASYAIWVDVLPALGVLDRVVLWTTEAAEVITLKSALLALIIGTLTLVAWKNVPGLLEIAVLQRLPLEASSRFAIATLTSYVIAVIGMVATFNQFGIGWQNVQWLVAAMTVGLGFGLQEIFANFVSGLIILFERPVRVGDVVTAGDVTGAVSKIRIRATTITNWDRKELIIPNKEFVTGRVMNWTLSDQVNRITINVGVAYGTDAATVLEILEQIAAEHPNILEDPPSIISFEEFGASSLNFVLRAYLPSLENRLRTITEVHQMIQSRFADANIEIAFPQQDLHVRSIDAALPFLTRMVDHHDEADAA